MGDDLTTLVSFLTNIINTESLTALTSQMTQSSTSPTKSEPPFSRFWFLSELFQS